MALKEEGEKAFCFDLQEKSNPANNNMGIYLLKLFFGTVTSDAYLTNLSF